MVLRIPKKVLDRDLLEDEPFLSHFAAQKPQGDPISGSRHSSERPKFYGDVEGAMRAEINGLDAARAWIRTVFRDVFVEEADLKSQDLDAFTKFYWQAYAGGDRFALHSLHEESKLRPMICTCSIAASIITQPLPPRPVPVPAQQSNLPAYKNIRPKQSSRAIREPKKLKGEMRPASRVAGAKRSSLTAPVPRPRRLASSTSPVSAPSQTSQQIRVNDTKSTPASHSGFQHSASPTPRRKRGRKRRAEKTPSHSGTSSADENPSAAIDSILGDRPSSPLTALCDSENEMSVPPEARTAPPTSLALNSEDIVPDLTTQNSADTRLSLGLRVRPTRKAAHPERLRQLMTDKNMHEEDLRRGKISISHIKVEESTSSARRQVSSSRGKSEVKSRKPRTKKPRLAKILSANDRRPKKKRREDSANPIVSPRPAEADISSAEPRKEKTRESGAFFGSPCRLDLDDVAPNAEHIAVNQFPSIPISHTPLAVTARAQVSVDKGKKRLRDDSPIIRVTEEPRKAPKDEPRLTIRLPKRPFNARVGSAAPSPMRPSGIEYADSVIQDAAENGLIVLQNEEEQASEWEQDPDDPQPGDSSDEEGEPPKLRKKKERWAKHRTQSRGESINIFINNPQSRRTETVSATIDPPYSTSIDYVEDQDMEVVTPELNFFEHDDPRLTPCPLFDDPPPSQDEKSALSNLPPIWAQSRQEVCESFDWFRSYQGGVYFVKDIVKGYLLSAFASSRDLFHHGGKLIISHGGGKAAQSLAKAPGTVIASDQQEDDKSVRALLHNYRTNRPLVLIIDDKYALFPFDLASKQCTYAILGWYQIAYAWAEFQGDPTSPTGRVVRYKFAFQWCEAQGSPWWATSAGIPLEPSGGIGATSEDDADNTDQKVGQVCTRCSQWSPEVYEEGWMCLKPRCTAFWYLLDASEVPTSLNYSASFLRPVKLETPQTLEDLRPSLPVLAVSNKKEQLITTSRHFCKGWHCTKCGRLSSRYKWEHWECRHCGATYSILGRRRTANEFFSPPKGSFDTHKINSMSGIFSPKSDMFRSAKGFGVRVTFVLPHSRGKIHALLSRPTMNAQANDLLRQYQEQASEGLLKFRRWPLRSHKCRGTLLTNYFSQNTGEPYQYVGGTANTVPFDDAPTAVVGALDLIKTRIQEAGLFDPNFNEVLTAAYMEEQKMAFHSDAERGLGPNVASLSLGAGAYMHFRIHAQYAAQDGLSGSREVLTLFLRHGDVVVMEGAGIQQYYEHTVVPLNFRIAATARFIGNEHLGG